MKRITIIGGGASGTLLAINLLDSRRDDGLEINLVEKRSRVGRGVAFGTEHDVHLLNVPAGKMGAFPDDVEHFHRWLLLQGHSFDDHAFVPRRLFAGYLNSLLEERRICAASVDLNLCDSNAVDIDFERDHALVKLENGDSLFSDAVVLAFGNFLPPHPTVPDLAFTHAEKYFRDPWSPNIETHIEADDSILIIGTGLSMADMVMRLNERDHRGMITAISTRGILPAVHRLGFSHPSIYEELRGRTKITDLMKRVRREIRAAESNESDWRAVIDSLRPHTQQIWLGLPVSEQKYFKQHLSRYWNAARHRMPPETSAVIQNMRNDGRLEVIKGRLRSIVHRDDFEVTYTVEANTRTISADAIINCIGSESNFKKLDSLLLKNLFRKGYIRSDALEFGLDALPNGGIIDGNGNISRRLFALGTALKGILWESTAIPEIRVQARDLAKMLLQN
jgi:uncharacterized NAD(P)/FAD-binding protein YdhS